MDMESDGEASTVWDILTNIEVSCAPIYCVTHFGGPCVGGMVSCAI